MPLVCHATTFANRRTDETLLLKQTHCALNAEGFNRLTQLAAWSASFCCRCVSDLAQAGSTLVHTGEATVAHEKRAELGLATTLILYNGRPRPSIAARIAKPFGVER